MCVCVFVCTVHVLNLMTNRMEGSVQSSWNDYFGSEGERERDWGDGGREGGRESRGKKGKRYNKV